MRMILNTQCATPNCNYDTAHKFFLEKKATVWEAFSLVRNFNESVQQWVLFPIMPAGGRFALVWLQTN